MSNVNFVLFINKKDQHRDLYNYLNQRVIAVINNLDSSTLGDNLLSSQQAIIPGEAVENDQESVTCSNKVAININKYDVISLVLESFCLRNHSYA